MATPEKEQAVAQLVEKINTAKAIIVTDYSGMDVLSISELRKRCRAASVEYKVVKNTLTKIAIQQTQYGLLADKIEGPTALALSVTDEIAPARVLCEFRKDHELPKIKLGLVEGRIVNSADVGRLAFLPPKKVLLGHFAGTLRRPLSMFSFALTFKLRQLAVALEELKKKKTE
ncbi:MAG: 50S ribosomal protein L10 [Candidatus Eisenbacteria bacterium]|nr:50S ribosomal protein L10 [Candidatus Eisenbacteria bacterium]